MTLSIVYESPSRARKRRPKPTPTDASIAWRPIPYAIPRGDETP